MMHDLESTILAFATVQFIIPLLPSTWVSPEVVFSFWNPLSDIPLLYAFFFLDHRTCCTLMSCIFIVCSIELIKKRAIESKI